MLFKKQKPENYNLKRCNVIAYNITVQNSIFQLQKIKKQEEPVNYGKIPIYIVKKIDKMV